MKMHDDSAEPASVVSPFFDRLPVPAVIYDMQGEGRTHFVNAAFTEVFGYLPEDVPDLQSWAEQAYPDAEYRTAALARGWAEVEEHKRSGRTLPASEYLVVDKTGRTRNVLIGFSVYGDILLATFQDISDLRTAEAAHDDLRNMADRAAFALTENMPGGAYTMVLAPGETTARFRFVSSKFLKMLDLDRDALIADPMVMCACVHRDDRHQWVAVQTKAHQSREPFSQEARVVVRGETRWIRAESVPRILEDGSVIWEGVLVDITRLKTAEQRLGSVLDAASAYVWTLDMPSNHVVFNKRWAQAHGLSPDDLERSLNDWFLLTHPDDRHVVKDALARLMRPDSSTESATYRRLDAAGNWMWLKVFAGVSERDLDGAARVISGVSFDVTEEHTRWLAGQDIQAGLREDLQRAHQRDTVAEVAGGIAHDLNNHIGLLLWNIEKLDALGHESDEIAESLNQMRRAVDISRDLISGLGDLGRPQTSRSHLNLGEVFQTAFDLIGRRRLERHNLQLHLPEDDVPIWADRTEILQVIVNLTVNACEAGTEDTPATVEIAALSAETALPDRRPDAGGLAHGRNEIVIFRITDTGAGMTDDVRARIFQRNFTTKGSDGTGLGLLIVARILQNNGAALWVDTRPDMGTTMTIAWPRTGVALGAVAPQMPRHEPDFGGRIDPTLLKGVQALVVDDLQDVAMVLGSMLESAGAYAYCETDPEFAKEVLADKPGDWSVLVTDLHMAGTDGQALARFAAGLTPPIPVVLVTARPDTLSDFNLQCFAAVLSKPVSGAQLVKVARQVVDAKAGFGTQLQTP